MDERLTRLDPLPWPARVVLAPAVWLERSRGRARLGIAIFYGLLLAVAVVLLWRKASLNGLPDVGDPFDLGAFGTVALPDAENAAIPFRAAIARLRKPPENGDRRIWGERDWSKAAPEVRAWADSNREALEAWQIAAERPRALWIQPREMSFSADLRDVQELGTFTRLALLEGSRRAEAGDPASAAGLYRALILSTRHATQPGGTWPRIRAFADLRLAANRLNSWSADPRVDARALRVVLDAAVAAEAITPPPSDLVRGEYFCLIREVEHFREWTWENEVKEHLWYNHLPGATQARFFFRREPERSRRVLRLVFANYLAYCDRPTLPPPAVTTPWLYRTDPSAPPAALVLTPEEIASWSDSTILARFLVQGVEIGIGQARADLSLVRSLQVVLAEQLYRRDHAGSGPPKLGPLVGPYLKRLPEGFAPGDPTFNTPPQPPPAPKAP